MKHAKEHAVIFDFDGTIADSFDAFLEALQATVNRTNRLSSEQIEDLRKSSTKEVMRKLGIGRWQLPMLVMKGRREIKNRYSRVNAFAGIDVVLKTLSRRYPLYIVSTNDRETIVNFLEKYGLRDCVAGIYGSIGILGKARALKKVCTKEALTATKCLYVGDETRDIEAANNVGMKCVAVTWGYNHADILRSCKPYAIANKPQELLKAIQGQET